MFDHALFDAGRSGSGTFQRRHGWMALAYIFEGILLGALALVPLINTEALPRILGGIMMPVPPPPAGTHATPGARVVRPRVWIDPLVIPPVIPNTVVQLRDEPVLPPSEALAVAGDVPGGIPDGLPGGILHGIGVGETPPPPPAASRSTPVKQIVVGGQVEAAKIIFQPTPEYPALAKMARIQGTVRLEAVISRDGRVEDLKVLSGHPLLVKAAVEAVSRWRYQPTLLNGEPVEVLTTIDVNFRLGE